MKTVTKGNNMTLQATDSRYPYTYSADYIRSVAGYEKISRSDAALIVSLIATILGMDDKELKKKIADKYIQVQNT